MKDLAATASGRTPAPRAQAYALLADLEGYPSWASEMVPTAQVLERDDAGEPSRIKTTLRGSVGPIGGEFRIHMAVALQPESLIELRRLPKTDDDHEEVRVVWRLADARGGEGTEVELALSARLSIPRLVPVGGVADSFARDFLESALQELRARTTP